MNKYVYFVSYFCTYDSGIGFGNCEIETDEEITSLAQIVQIQKSKVLNEDSQDCVILSFKLLRTEEDPDAFQG